MRYLIFILVLASVSFAQPLSLGTPSNEKRVFSPFFNMGFGVGVLTPASSPRYEKEATAFVNPSLLASIQFTRLSALTFEVDLTTTASDVGVGGWVGFEQQLMTTWIAPFVELQIGARKPATSFGPAGSLNGGIMFFTLNNFRIRLKGGYEMILNDDYDQSWNAEVGVLFAFGKPGLEEIEVK